MTRWRQRMGEDKAHRAVAGEPFDRDQDGSSQAVRLCQGDRRHDRAGKSDRLSGRREADASRRERLVRLAAKHGVTLRQSYARVGKLALFKQQRYAHAKQFKRAKRSLKTLTTFLGRVIRDIARRIRATRLWKSSSRIIPETEGLVGINLARIIADRGYCGHGAPQEHRFKVYTAGQKRRITDKIKCELGEGLPSSRHRPRQIRTSHGFYALSH
jgi:hypothetical protein